MSKKNGRMMLPLSPPNLALTTFLASNSGATDAKEDFKEEVNTESDAVSPTLAFLVPR